MMASVTKVQPLIRCTQAARQAGPALTLTLRAEFSNASGLSFVDRAASNSHEGDVTRRPTAPVPRRFVPPVISYEAWETQRVRVRDLSSPFSPMPRPAGDKARPEATERLRELEQ